MKKRMPDKPHESDKGNLASFDLRNQPWIPVVRDDGQPDELSLRMVLHEAPALHEIRDSFPTVEFGLYRLLVAVILDMFELQSADDLEPLLEAGKFDDEGMESYFERKCSDRFDLFHPKHPFLQTPGMANEKPKPLARLLQPLPSGTNANHFHHAREADFGVSPAMAARLLTTIAPFMTAGGAGLSPSINGAPPWYVLVRGRNLFESLCLNCPVLMDLLPQAIGTGMPAWRGTPPEAAERRSKASLVESLTWQPRRVQLIPDGAGRCSLTGRESRVLVREMKFCAGLGAGFEWTDPNVPYRIAKDGRNVLRPREGKAVWRDTGPISLLREREYQSENSQVRFERPPIVSQFAYLLDRKMVDLPLDLVLYGMRTDLKKKVFEWYREGLSLPASLVLRTQFHGVAQQEMDRAESVAFALQQAIKKAYPREAAGNKAAFKTLIVRAQNDYWTPLRSHYFGFLEALAALPQDGTGVLPNCLSTWRKAIRRLAEAALFSAIDDLDSDADALERQMAALRSFGNSLFVLLDPDAAARMRAKKKEKPKKEDKE